MKRLEAMSAHRLYYVIVLASTVVGISLGHVLNMVAGIVHASMQNLGVEECARLATAFSLGTLGEIGPRLPARDVIEALTHQVTTRRIAP